METSIQVLTEILDAQIQVFLQDIKKECRIDSRKLHPDKSGFPIFHPESNYYEKKYYEQLIEWRIRDYLVTDVMFKWFISIGFKCFAPNQNTNDNIIRFSYSNEQFGDDFPLAFILQTTDGERIGYRYSSMYMEDKDLDTLLNYNNLDHIEVIDWRNPEDITSELVNWSISPQKRNLVYFVTLQSFLTNYFSEEVFDIYITKVRSAIKSAEKEIGLQTIPELSLKYLSTFKETVSNILIDFPLETKQYRKFNKLGQLTRNTVSLLPTSDYSIIRERCYSSKLFQSLLGDESFARCFVTSEYLFNIFKAGNQNFFDYTTVVSGYFKSVELLLERIMLATLGRPNHDSLWIKAAKCQLKIDNINCRSNPKTSEKQVKFTSSNQQYFSTEMGPLIWFLHDNSDGWYISPDGRNLVHECLINFNKDCRNEHMHKDIIDNTNVVEAVRDNTILCLLFLLGGCKIYGSASEDYRMLKAKDDSFDRLYKALIKIPKSVDEFFIKFPGEEEFTAIRLHDQEAPQFDDNGSIISTIKFIKVPDFPIDDYNALIENIDNMISVTRTNCPEKVCWYTKRKGKNAVV